MQPRDLHLSIINFVLDHGLLHSPWFMDTQWDRAKMWGRPLLGDYRSDDEDALRQHAAWLTHAGVDYILIDWSNNCEFTYKNGCTRPDLRFIQDATKTLFRVWSSITPRTPKIAIMIGSPEQAARYTKHRGAALQEKADEVWELFVAPYRDLYFTYHGKPLLVDYVGTNTRCGMYGCIVRKIAYRVYCLSRLHYGILEHNYGRATLVCHREGS